MNLHLTHKVALVTGASRGIGRAIAQTLSAEGMRVTLAARSLPDLQQTASLCPHETLLHPCDLRDPAAPAELISATLARFGQLDLLVNNAGATQRGDFLTLPDETWSDGFALKFFGYMRCSRAAWPHLARSHGSIVNIVGVGGRTGSAEFTIGGSVNAAVLNLTKSLADRGQSDHVRVNAINPGSVHTDRLQKRITAHAQSHHVDDATAAQQLAHSQGIPRFGAPAEIASAVAFLASPHAAFIQGAILDIDGGQTRTL
jgi:3-oxoacyl-[acyl-carrier protein] reductase